MQDQSAINSQSSIYLLCLKKKELEYGEYGHLPPQYWFRFFLWFTNSLVNILLVWLCLRHIIHSKKVNNQLIQWIEDMYHIGTDIIRNIIIILSYLKKSI